MALQLKLNNSSESRPKDLPPYSPQAHARRIAEFKERFEHLKRLKDQPMSRRNPDRERANEYQLRNIVERIRAYFIYCLKADGYFIPLGPITWESIKCAIQKLVPTNHHLWDQFLSLDVISQRNEVRDHISMLFIPNSRWEHLEDLFRSLNSFEAMTYPAHSTLNSLL